MNSLQLALLSAILAQGATAAAAIASAARWRRPALRFLAIRTVLYAFAGGAAALGGTIIWIIWCERTSGFSAGNAPLGWIFFYGPISVAVEEFIALVHWLAKDPISSRRQLDRPNSRLDRS